MRQRTVTVLGGVLVGLVGACNSLDEPAPQDGVRVVIPVDSRPTVQALSKLPAISGGTLAISADGQFAVAADPDRDRVSIVDLRSDPSTAVRHIALNPGDEPGRVAVDASGQAYVAMRRSGDVARIDIAGAQMVQRTHVCSAARGLAVDANSGLLHVACADGRLVSLRAADVDSRDIVREVNLQTDLRDVLVRGNHLLVSTFKNAELLNIDVNGKIESQAGATEFSVFNVKAQEQSSSASDAPQPLQSVLQPMLPHLAWRMAQSADGAVFMLHQGASEGVVDITKTSPQVDSSPYGGGSFGGCSGIVTPALTTITATGDVHTSGLMTGVLTVDMAVSSGGAIAVVQAGAADGNAPRPTTLFDASGGSTVADVAPTTRGVGFGGPSTLPDNINTEETGTSLVTRFDAGSTMRFKQFATPLGDCQGGSTQPVVGQATAVAFTPSGQLVVQSREPGFITVVPDGSTGQVVPQRVYALGGESVRDTGHEIFHRDAGGGIACVSCHAEGAEDGHTWKFTKLGERRTQALHVGLEGTAPFHWSGDEVDLNHIMEDVFVGRMGGVHQSGERLGALTNWLFALRPPTPIVSAESQSALRGKALFESGETGCTGCHAGDKLTNNKNSDVGTGGSLQVPSLLGVGYRAPYMHTGCAATLRDRFDPACGGANHGHTAQLQAAEIDDMVTYLQTL